MRFASKRRQTICFAPGFESFRTFRTPRFALAGGEADLAELRPSGFATLEILVDIVLIDPTVASRHVSRNLAVIGQLVEMALRTAETTRPFAHRQPDLAARRLGGEGRGIGHGRTALFRSERPEFAASPHVRWGKRARCA